MFEGLKLRKRVAELEEEMLKLTRVIQARDLDWKDMYARCKRLLDRTEKAAQRVEASDTGEDVTETQPSADVLTPRQSLVQQQILKRRRANGILPPTG